VGRVGTLELEAQAAIACHHEQIELGTGMDCPLSL